MPARRTTRTPAKRSARAAKKPVKPVTARALLKGLTALRDTRGLDGPVLLGALCEVIAGHQPTARKAMDRITAMLDAAGIR